MIQCTMNPNNPRTKRRLLKGIAFLDIIAQLGRTPISVRVLDKQLSSGGTATGRYLRTCLKRVTAAAARNERCAEYVVIPEKLTELKNQLKEKA